MGFLAGFLLPLGVAAIFVGDAIVTGLVLSCAGSFLLGFGIKGEIGA